MPELPEITVIAQQMNKEITGKCIAAIEAKQLKNLNMPVLEFIQTAKGKVVDSVSAKGKWIIMKLEPASYMFINLGMGGDLIYFTQSQKLPEKYAFKLTFTDKTGFTASFFWFGYIHLVEKEMKNHKMTANLGVSPLEEGFTFEYFRILLSKKKTRIKSFLLDQKNIAGIGNVYAQDILFKAKLHPDRKASDLSDEEVKNLYNSIQNVINRSIKLNGLVYERDFYGKNGRFTADEFLVGYKTGKPCPVCGTYIEKIKTGSTSTYICPKCQQK